MIFILKYKFMEFNEKGRVLATHDINYLSSLIDDTRKSITISV